MQPEGQGSDKPPRPADAIGALTRLFKPRCLQYVRRLALMLVRQARLGDSAKRGFEQPPAWGLTLCPCSSALGHLGSVNALCPSSNLSTRQPTLALAPTGHSRGLPCCRGPEPEHPWRQEGGGAAAAEACYWVWPHMQPPVHHQVGAWGELNTPAAAFLRKGGGWRGDGMLPRGPFPTLEPDPLIPRSPDPLIP